MFRKHLANFYNKIQSYDICILWFYGPRQPSFSTSLFLLLFILSCVYSIGPGVNCSTSFPMRGVTWPEAISLQCFPSTNTVQLSSFPGRLDSCYLPNRHKIRLILNIGNTREKLEDEGGRGGGSEYLRQMKYSSRFVRRHS